MRKLEKDRLHFYQKNLLPTIEKDYAKLLETINFRFKLRKKKRESTPGFYSTEQPPNLLYSSSIGEIENNYNDIKPLDKIFLDAMINGYSTTEIAEHYKISVITVETHIDQGIRQIMSNIIYTRRLYID